MSREDIQGMLIKFWIGIAVGIVVMVVGAISTNIYIAKAASERSVRNESKIEKLDNGKKDKGADHGIHGMLLEKVNNNRNDISNLEDKVDENYNRLSKGQSEIKTLILNLHTK